MEKRVFYALEQILKGRDAAAQQDAWYSGQREKKKERAFPLLG